MKDSKKIKSSGHLLNACIPLVVIIMGFSTHITHAQTANPSNEEIKNYGKFSLGYLNNMVYYGRQDSLPTPYFTPSIAYYDKSGFYISGSISYLLTKKSGRIDLGSIDIGYEHSITDNLSGSVYANKSWYNQSSSNIKNDIKGSAGGSLSYDLNLIQLNGGIDVTFASKTDIGLNAGISHLFRLGQEENGFSFEPTFLANWNTLNSYEGYINKKLGRRQSTALPINTTISATTSVQNNRMTLLDYELTLPLTYESKNIGFSLMPTFAFPKNPIYTTTTIVTKLNGVIQNSQTLDSTPLSEKSLNNNFYVELTLFFKF